MRKLLLLVLAFLSISLQVARAQNPNTAAFPTAVATDTDLLVAQNSARSSLTSSINNVGTTVAIPVVNASVFTTPTVVTIDSEAVKICSQNNSTNVLTACVGGRAFHGTIANHASGATVTAFIDQYYTNQLAAEVKAIETAIGAALANVVQVGGSYANPSWITSLAWAKLTGVPGSFTPSAHASTHAGAGSDPITSLGAVSHTGNVTFGTDATYDIGASGANRPRHYYGGGNILALSTGTIGFASRSGISSPADGQLLLQNNAGTDLARIMYGGTTSSFPAIKRSGTTLAVRLADDSADAPFTASALTLSAQPHASVKLASDQTSLSGSGIDTIVSWNTDVVNVGSMHSTSTNPSRVTIAVAGTYHIALQWGINTASSPDTVTAYIRKNGTTTVARVRLPAFNVNSEVDLNIHTIEDLAATDYLEVILNLSVDGSGSFPAIVAANTWFKVVRLY